MEDTSRSLFKIDDNTYEVPLGYRPGMRVPGRIFVSAALRNMVEPGTVDQVANVATLPGIVKYSMAMPDAHLGYGFPIGGVAAFREEEGIISPGGWALTSTAVSGCCAPTLRQRRCSPG